MTNIVVNVDYEKRFKAVIAATPDALAESLSKEYFADYVLVSIESVKGMYSNGGYMAFLEHRSFAGYE